MIHIESEKVWWVLGKLVQHILEIAFPSEIDPDGPRRCMKLSHLGSGHILFREFESVTYAVRKIRFEPNVPSSVHAMEIFIWGLKTPILIQGQYEKFVFAVMQDTGNKCKSKDKSLIDGSLKITHDDRNFALTNDVMLVHYRTENVRSFCLW